jgi:hypothetical protein
VCNQVISVVLDAHRVQRHYTQLTHERCDQMCALTFSCWLDIESNQTFTLLKDIFKNISTMKVLFLTQYTILK